MSATIATVACITLGIDGRSVDKFGQYLASSCEARYWPRIAIFVYSSCIGRLNIAITFGTEKLELRMA